MRTDAIAQVCNFRFIEMFAWLIGIVPNTVYFEPVLAILSLG
jgi:hypothetical protein